MGQKVIQKRFIAGVVCPKCGEMDKIRMFRDDKGDELRDCVACGFTETYAQHKESKDSEPLYEEITTRVTPVGKTLLDEEEKPLRIMTPTILDSGKGRSDH